MTCQSDPGYNGSENDDMYIKMAFEKQPSMKADGSSCKYTKGIGHVKVGIGLLFLLFPFLSICNSMSHIPLIDNSDHNHYGLAEGPEKYVDTTHREIKDTTQQPAVQKGFVPIPIIITDPAFGGIGGGLTLGYLHSNRLSVQKDTPPIISGITGGYTANHTWFLGIGHSHSFKNDRIRYTGGVLLSNINIAFYATNQYLSNETRPFNVNLKSLATLQNLLFRIKETNFFLGPSYFFMFSEVRLDEQSDHPLYDSLVNNMDIKSKLGMLGIAARFDSRDNTLSPDKGIIAALIFHYNAPYFGGDGHFPRTNFYGKFYLPVAKKVFSAFRFEIYSTGDEAPFYAKPFVSLRGVPTAKYQGDKTVVVETQWRWVFYKSFSILGFTGTGKAFDSFNEFESAKWIYNYGGGVRYTIKKLFDLRVGVDVAWSNEDFAWYFSIGSSF